jgi:hypothetical protein
MHVDVAEYFRIHRANMALATGGCERTEHPCTNQICTAQGQGTFVGETKSGVIQCHFCETPVMVAIEEGTRLAA